MSAAPSIAADAGALSPSAPISSAPPSLAPPPAAVRAPIGLPEPGGTWNEIYDVHALLDAVGGARAWSAVRIDTMEPVVLRAVSASAGDPRAEAWRTLETIGHPNLLRALASHAAGPFRIEVQAAAPGETLDAWRKRQAPDEVLIERLLRSVGGALQAMHGQGLAHFGVRPKNIFVREEQGVVDFVLGGFETAAALAQPGLLTIAVDPLNAPPEAAGLFQHSPGPGLCAWDWWSLGRVVQEMVLGRHVLAHLLQREISAASPELMARAEGLLLERDPGATRAGAVEAMPPMDQRLAQLLRGLLSSARDARWDGEHVARWLRREPVQELYRLPRTERMFRWGDRARTVAESAEALRSAEHGAEAVAQLWEPGKPGTLAHFLVESGAHRAIAERLDELRRLETAFSLKTLPGEMVREAIAAVALLELAGGRLTWRGEVISEEAAAKIFSADSDDGVDRLGLLQAFTARPIVLLVERSDVTAARVLAEFAHVATGAETIVRQARWLPVGDAAGRARLLRTSLLSPTELGQAAKSLHDRFACSTDPAAERLLNLPQPIRSELVALVWAGGDAVRRGFLTHRQWAEGELARLQAAARAEVANLGWLQLSRALSLGPWVFARWRWLVPAWLLWAPVAMILWPGPRWLPLAAASLAVGVIVRLAAVGFLRRDLQRFCPEARPWGMRDGRARCIAELGAYRMGRPAASVRAELDRLNAQIVKLTALEVRPRPVALPPRFTSVLAFALGGWLLFAGGIAGAAWRAKTHRPSRKEIDLAWHPPKPVAPAGGIVAGQGEDDKPLGPVKVSWPFKPGDEAQVLLVNDSVEATPAQLRWVAEYGLKRVDPYKPATINTLIILRVPTKDKFGLMVYDGVARQLVATKVYLLDYAPLAKAWVEVAGRKGIYLPD